MDDRPLTLDAQGQTISTVQDLRDSGKLGRRPDMIIVDDPEHGERPLKSLRQLDQMRKAIQAMRLAGVPVEADLVKAGADLKANLAGAHRLPGVSSPTSHGSPKAPPPMPEPRTNRKTRRKSKAKAKATRTRAETQERAILLRRKRTRGLKPTEQWRLYELEGR